MIFEKFYALWISLFEEFYLFYIIKLMNAEQNVSRTRKKITTVVIFLIIFGILAWWGGAQVGFW